MDNWFFKKNLLIDQLVAPNVNKISIVDKEYPSQSDSLLWFFEQRPFHKPQVLSVRTESCICRPRSIA